MIKIFVGGEYQYDYLKEVSDDDPYTIKHSLFYCKDEGIWSSGYSGMLAIGMTENSDTNIKFDKKIGKVIDCSYAQQLLILLRIYHQNPIHKQTIELFEKTLTF